MGKFNEDEHVPSWMDETFFEEVLRKCENAESVSIKDMKTSPASALCDHYASVVIRAVITYDTNTLKGCSKSMIIKTMPQDVKKVELLGETRIFETEIGMCTKTIPSFEAELRKIGDNTVLGPKVLYNSLKPRKCIIFEDLCLDGYAMMRDRHADLEEVKAIFLKLAKWHAVSYKLSAEGDTSVTEYQESFLNFKDVETWPYLTSGIENFIEKLETLEEFQIYIPKLRLLQKDLISRCISSIKSYNQKGSKGIHVLCHGDFHRKNIMFKHNTQGKFEDVIFLDFQLCYFGPAIFDVVYAFYMLVGSDLRTNHFEELVYYYSSNFIELLKKLKFRGHIPQIADFHIDLLRFSHWEILLATTFMPIWNAYEKTDIRSDDIMHYNDIRKKFYDNPDFIAELRKVLPRMLYRGYFET